MSESESPTPDEVDATADVQPPAELKPPDDVDPDEITLDDRRVP